MHDISEMAPCNNSISSRTVSSEEDYIIYCYLYNLLIMASWEQQKHCTKNDNLGAENNNRKISFLHECTKEVENTGGYGNEESFPLQNY